MHGPVNLVLRHQLTCHNVALSNPLIGKCFVFIFVLVWNFVPCRMLLIVVRPFSLVHSPNLICVLFICSTKVQSTVSLLVLLPLVRN